MLDKLTAPFLSKVLGGLSLALLISLALTWQWGKAGWRNAESCQIARANDRKAYELAAKEAEAKAVAAKLATEARYRAAAEKTNGDYQTALARAQRASDAYRMRNQAARRAPSHATPPADNRSPESPDRSGADAELVAVTRQDFDVLVENSVRLKAAHEWAKTLNVEPVPDPTF